MARTTRDKPTAEKICNAIAEGNTHRTSCAIAGVSHTFFYEWMNDDVAFADMVKEAEAEAERWHVENIKRHAKDNWLPSAWMLERRNPKEWGKKDKLDITTNDKDLNEIRVVHHTANDDGTV